MGLEFTSFKETFDNTSLQNYLLWKKKADSIEDNYSGCIWVILSLIIALFIVKNCWSEMYIISVFLSLFGGALGGLILVMPINFMLYGISKQIFPSLKQIYRKMDFFKKKSIPYLSQKEIQHEIIYFIEKQQNALMAHKELFNAENLKKNSSRIQELKICFAYEKYERALPEIYSILEYFNKAQEKTKDDIETISKLKQFETEHALFKQSKELIDIQTTSSESNGKDSLVQQPVEKQIELEKYL